MRKRVYRLLLVVIYFSFCVSAYSQERSDSIRSGGAMLDSLKKSGIIFNDSLKRPEISLSKSQAVSLLQHRIQPQYWNHTNDSLRLALSNLIFEASHTPFDSTEYFLKRYPFDSLKISWDKFYIWEPLRLKIADEGMKDTTILVVIDTLNEVTSSSQGFPFKYFNYPYQGDSIKEAVNFLLKYLEDRDSTIIKVTGLGDALTPVWLNSKSDNMIRYWLKNEFSDSATLWIGSPARNTMSLYLEHGVNFRRPLKQGNYAEAKTNVKALDNSRLLSLQKIVTKPQYWKYRTEASLVLSQASLTNWVKGGESSISTALDITGYADFENKAMKVSSKNFARMKLGFLASGDNTVRKNLDLVETNSKLNHKAFGKFDFSGIMLFKTQVASGYRYSPDTLLVSKFMNPAILTIGFGLDYKPNKNTSINLSPLSYKGTFVTDTANIDQTKYGIAKDRKSKNEPGASFMITNEYKPVKNLTVTNRLQLFTNYINNPLNIDVDWEMIVVANLNWFTDVRFNTHLIFDDDTKTLVLDKNKKPVLRPDGTQKKTARMQFKEMLGFSLVFRF